MSDRDLRSIFYFRPDVDLIANAPVGFQIDVVIASVRGVAVHPARPRVLGAARLPAPSVHRVQVPRDDRDRAASHAPWLGAGLTTHPSPDHRLYERDAANAMLEAWSITEQ